MRKTTTWRPSSNDYLEALRNQNPWERTGRVPAALVKEVRRPLAEALWKSMLKTPFRHQVVLGPRRVGKTVALYQTIENLIGHGIAPSRLWFLRLDHPLLMHFELGSWARSLIKNYNGTSDAPLFLFLDEVNYSANWDKWIKTFYDEQWPLRIVATSSSTAALRNRTVESGIGRWSEQHMTPYTFSEFLALRQTEVDRTRAEADFGDHLRSTIETRPDYARHAQTLMRFLLIGGFPELLESFSETDIEGNLLRSQQILRSEAVQRVTGMDIPQAFDIKSPLILEKLLYVLAGQMCGLMNISSLASDLGLTRPTVHSYIDYLEKAYLILTLPNFSTREESVQRKGRKVFFVDGAVRNAALQRGLAPLNDSTESGFLIENAVASHLFAWSLQSGGRLFHWRDGQDEVDFVYSESDRPLAIEVAKKNHSLRGLKAIQGRYPKLKGRCYLVSAESPVWLLPEEDPDGIGRIPLVAFLITLGHRMTTSLHARFGA